MKKQNLPLDCAVLKYFTTVDEASVVEVMEAIKDGYSDYRPFTRKGVSEVLMTGVVNGMLVETRYELEANGDLKVYYKADEEGRRIINKYLP
jgi:hypothetical protein